MQPRSMIVARVRSMVKCKRLELSRTGDVGPNEGLGSMVLELAALIKMRDNCRERGE